MDIILCVYIFYNLCAIKCQCENKGKYYTYIDCKYYLKIINVDIFNIIYIKILIIYIYKITQEIIIVVLMWKYAVT